MGRELKEPRQAGDPTELKSDGAVLGDESTTTPTGVDPSLPFHDLAGRAREAYREAEAAKARAWMNAVEQVAQYAETPLPWAMLHPETLTNEAMEQVSLAMAAGERTGYLAGFEAASTLFPMVRAAGYAEGQKDLAVGQDAGHRAWQQEMSRLLVEDLTKSVPYAELCERRGEPERAERARQVLAERGIA